MSDGEPGDGVDWVPATIPGALVVRAWTAPDGVLVSWPEGAERPDALSACVEQFSLGLPGTEVGAAWSPPVLPPGHPHRAETATMRAPWSGPGSEVEIRYVEMQVTDGLERLGLHEPSAAERARGASVEADPSPGPMIVQRFTIAPQAPPEAPVQPTGPPRSWVEFRQAILDEAARHRDG